MTRGAWRAVLPDRVSNPDPVHSPVGTSWLGGWLYKGALTERWTIVTWRSPSTHKVIWIVLWIFRSIHCDFLPRHGCRLPWSRFVLIGLYFGTNTMDVVDLDLSLCPDVFGLKAFDEKMPITRMLPGSSPCELRLLLPDTNIGKDGFHDVVVENLIGSSTWRSRHVSPSDIIALRQRWPRAVFQVMKERSTELEDLRRQAYTGLQWAYRYAHPGYCPECKTKTDSHTSTDCDSIIGHSPGGSAEWVLPENHRTGSYKETPTSDVFASNSINDGGNRPPDNRSRRDAGWQPDDHHNRGNRTNQGTGD